jgi:flagellar basal body-associated protein FliL
MSKADPHADEHAAAAPAPAAGGSMMGRLLVIVLVMVVVCVECAVAYLCIPAGSSQASLEGNTASPKSSAEKKKEKENDEAPIDLVPPSDASQMMEVDLGDYSVTVYKADSNSTIRFDFKVSGTIKLEDKKVFDEEFEKYKQRIREQVTSTIRNADWGDLTEPSLSVIKRTMLDRVRTTISKKPQLIREILIPDFSFTQN